jgi:hypothetical protein
MTPVQAVRLALACLADAALAAVSASERATYVAAMETLADLADEAL